MNMKRMRGRNHRPGGGGGGGGGSPIRHHNGQIPLNRNHVFDSNGPDLRIRGTAQQLFEKYLQLGRDATSSGDRVMAEGYFQHAEHYFRILNAIAQAAQQNQGGGNPSGPYQGGQNYGGGHPNNQQRGRSGDEQDGEDRGGEDPLISGGMSQAQPVDRSNQNGERQPREHQGREHQNREYQNREQQGGEVQNGDRPFQERQARPERQDRAERHDRNERHDRAERSESGGRPEPVERRFADIQAAENRVVDQPVQSRAEAIEPAAAASAEAEPVEQRSAPRPERQSGGRAAGEPRARAPRVPRERAAAPPPAPAGAAEPEASAGSKSETELTSAES